ncbi:MAG: aspartate--tRNA(Asn) ligase [Candidatus Fraserbacteria bacterium RBG_16_55_9]|uniref:Aspartate--tRNA(Asp/Asn) ligase n=1 Tax=Fraserbacteria sp. (strain RBG_16_55_9) TaxID=1817864 RepID=A0A1F5UPM8_FRAXR|nr:MAG: aspartate--tRNA(Asn) ligase [Candidatus Fraserbacteria bacterium RBG_16_55_9]
MTLKRTWVNEVKGHIGQRVLLKGWIHTLRPIGKLRFIVLRDRTGFVQAKLKGEKAPTEELKEEAAIQIIGAVVQDQRAPDGIEVDIEQLVILSSPVEPPPIQINRPLDVIGVRLETALDHRTLSLRHPEIGSVFRVRAELIWAFREYLRGQGFLEVQTPKIVAAGTEGGTALFAVQYFEQTAYLAQSPQFYKQMLVGAGYERVFEVGPVYRAEQHNTARHLNEYISLDYEMGFIDDFREITQLETELLRFMFEHIKRACPKELELYKAEVPKVPKEIPHLTLAEAIDILKKRYNKHCESDLDPEGEKLLCEYTKKELDSEFVFVTHYPRATRPMYAMPNEEDPTLTNSFDLLCRGLEITTGGQRIHPYNMLVESMRSRGLDPKSFEFYLEIFKYGMPPHGGLAIGAERLTAQLLNLSNVREASFFPRDRTRIVP